jgi:HEAT repeat protein
MNNLLLIAAGASLCLAVAMWIALVIARGLRHASSRRRRERYPSAGIAIAEFCGDGDVDALAAKLGKLAPDDVVEVAGRALPFLAEVNRRAVGAALERCGIGRHIRRRFDKANEHRRILYCELLAVIGGADATAVLGKATGNAQPAVRLAAAIALADHGRRLPLRELLERLGREARRSSRLVLLFAKLLPHQEDEIGALVLDRDAEDRLRLSALHALEMEDAPSHREFLFALEEESSPALAAAAARGLTSQTDTRAGDTLIRLLAHPAPEVRREAAVAIGRARLLAGRQALVAVTGDASPMVAGAAARSLWLLERERAPRPVSQADELDAAA